MKLGNTSEAEHAWRALIQQNPDSNDYYHGFLAAKGIDTGKASSTIPEQALIYTSQPQYPMKRGPSL